MMPMYEYKCEGCGKVMEEAFSIRDYQREITCDCGQPALRHITQAPAVRGDYAGYSCPITGSWIEGRAAHEANLRKHGCRILEPGETDRAAANRKADDEALDKHVESTAEAFVEKLGGEEREALGKALESGLDVKLDRK